MTDNTPITREWLLSIGFKEVPSRLGAEFPPKMQTGLISIYEYHGQWVYDWHDLIRLRTRGELRMLATLLKQPKEKPHA